MSLPVRKPQNLKEVGLVVLVDHDEPRRSVPHAPRRMEERTQLSTTGSPANTEWLEDCKLCTDIFQDVGTWSAHFVG